MSIDQQTVKAVVSFHGHMCAGLALGIRAAEVALDQVGAHAADEEVVAIVETDMCGVDAVQFLTGCTLGKGNLIHRDYGKNVYTFLRRSDEHAVRISTRAGSAGRIDAEGLALFAKVKDGTASAAERSRFAAMQAERSARILAAPLAELYEVRQVDVVAPPSARVLASVTCSACGEPAMETRVRRLHGQELCLPCFELAVAGGAPARSPQPVAAPAARTSCACSNDPAPA
jgi:formylmethanofuran dehydrogenase subunit E